VGTTGPLYDGLAYEGTWETVRGGTERGEEGLAGGPPGRIQEGSGDLSGVWVGNRGRAGSGGIRSLELEEALESVLEARRGTWVGGRKGLEIIDLSL